MPEPYDIDADLTNADWTKRTFDVIPSTREAFEDVLAWSGMTVAQFKRLPAYKAAVAPGGDAPRWLKDL
jgi:hypothetical protein